MLGKPQRSTINALPWMYVYVMDGPEIEGEKNDNTASHQPILEIDSKIKCDNKTFATIYLWHQQIMFEALGARSSSMPLCWSAHSQIVISKINSNLLLSSVQNIEVMTLPSTRGLDWLPVFLLDRPQGSENIIMMLHRGLICRYRKWKYTVLPKVFARLPLRAF